MSDDINIKPVVKSGSEKSHFEDEVLEALWEMREEDRDKFSDLIAVVDNEAAVRMMADDGYITISGDKVGLLPPGELRARDIIRRHRLAERLFHDVFDLSDFEEDACRMEHAISPEVEEAICTLLGHPPKCPHEKPIPAGKCCSVVALKMRPLIRTLRDTEVGRRAKVQFMTTPSMDRLASMGLVPGAVIRLSQKRPSYVIEIDETSVAVDEEIAKGIYVRQL